ncbi:MAG: hypothetical protein LUH01_09905, partial [Parabacteroides gordonii]|nr:hypothetical protein [Parabacteroides gordonii]
ILFQSFLPTVSAKYKHSLEELGLKGNVTSLTIAVGKAKKESREIKKADLLYTLSYTFNGEGDLVDYLFEDANGNKISFTGKYKNGRQVSLVGNVDSYYYTYDKDGRKLTEEYKSNTGNLLDRREFKYDKKGNCISESLYNEMSCLGTTNMKYNSENQLMEQVFSGNEDEDTRTVYCYDTNGCVQEEKVYDYENKLIHTYTYSYEMDDRGNWTKRIKEDKGVPVEIQERSFVYDGTPVVAVSSSSKSIFTIENFVGLLVGLLIFFMIGHMLWVINQGKRYKTIFTLEYFLNKRSESGLLLFETDEELVNEQNLLTQAFSQWTVVESDGETELRKPTKMRQIKAATAALDELIAMNPLNPEVISLLNEYAEVINTNEARTFNGSKTIIIIGFLFAAFFTYTTGTGNFWKEFFTSGFVMWGPVIVYILASRVPNYLLDKKQSRTGRVKSHGTLAFILGIIGSGFTVRETIKYSDGSKEVNHDNSAHFIAWFIALLVMVVIAAFMWVWAIFNYFRNYVFYF